MKSALFAAATLGAAFAFTGCGQGGIDVRDITGSSSGAQIGTAYLNELTKVAEALESVNDEASARAAAVRIRGAVEGIEAMGDELQDVESSPIRAMQVFGSSGTDIVMMHARIMSSVVRIEENHPELMPIIGEEMEALNN